MGVPSCNKSVDFWMATLETMKGLSIGKSAGNGFGYLSFSVVCISDLLGQKRGVFNQRRFTNQVPQLF